MLTYMLFSTIIQLFRVPLNVLVRTPVGTRNPGWESLLCMMLYGKSLTLFNGLPFPLCLSTSTHSYTEQHDGRLYY